VVVWLRVLDIAEGLQAAFETLNSIHGISALVRASGRPGGW
jgi:hypothetical protein